MAEVGQEVRRMREKRGWSQAKLAAGADMAVSGISQIETGARSPSAATLTKLARAFGVEVADLFPKVEVPLWLDESQERHHFDFRTAREGLEEYCERWDQIVSEEKLDRASTEEFFVTGLGFIPMMDIALAAELDVLRRTTGLEGSELLAMSDIAQVNKRYLALLVKVMKVVVDKGILYENNVIDLKEFRERLTNRPNQMFG